MRTVPVKRKPENLPRGNPAALVKVFALVASGFSALAISACAPAPKAQRFQEQSNTTGYKDKTGRSHTGAGDDQALDRLKQELTQDTAGRGATQEVGPEALDKEDRELAAQILGARIEESQTRIRVLVNLRDAGKLSFDFTGADIASKGTVANPDIRYKSIIGKTSSGEPSSFEMALLCRRATLDTPPEAARGLQCATATMSLKERHGSKAKAGFILRNQEVSVLVRSVNQETLKHIHLKRLAADFKTTRYGRLQSFEVAWGPSGFDLEMGDPSICPSGRLVETNDLDEPLKLNCKGTETYRDLEGRMIGNTTRGELFLEISATVPGMLTILPDGSERLFILVRQKKTPKPTAPKPTSPPQSGSQPNNPSNSPSPSNPIEPEEEEEDGFFLDEERPLVPAPQTGNSPQTHVGATGWMVPVDLSDSVTKSWAKDRKNPLVAKKVTEWQESRRFKAFATNYIPNRDVVINGLKASNVPAEFSFITLIESKFFIDDGYPVEVSSANAVGPWQFMPDTATDSRFGLKIEPLIPATNEKGRVTSHMASPCDERADLVKSSEAAGRYFRVLLNMFPRDPKLAVAAYNWGEGNVECLASTSKKCQSRTRRHSQERLREIRELGLSFWAIHRYNMAPSTTLNYVIDFVAAHHAALEMQPLKIEKAVAPWRPLGQCSRR
jgi:hypothetical protein